MASILCKSQGYLFIISFVHLVFKPRKEISYPAQTKYFPSVSFTYDWTDVWTSPIPIHEPVFWHNSHQIKGHHFAVWGVMTFGGRPWRWGAAVTRTWNIEWEGTEPGRPLRKLLLTITGARKNASSTCLLWEWLEPFQDCPHCGGDNSLSREPSAHQHSRPEMYLHSEVLSGHAEILPGKVVVLDVGWLGGGCFLITGRHSSPPLNSQFCTHSPFQEPIFLKLKPSPMVHVQARGPLVSQGPPPLLSNITRRLWGRRSALWRSIGAGTGCGRCFSEVAVAYDSQWDLQIIGQMKGR